MTHRKVFKIGPLEIGVNYPLSGDAVIDISWVHSYLDSYWTLSEIARLKEACEYVLENIEATRKEEEDVG